MTRTLRLVGHEEADRLLAEDPLALLLGMLLDQQVTMEAAFYGPTMLRERLGELDVGAIAHHDPDDFAQLCAGPPAVHRYPRSMAGRIQSVCAALAQDWDGRADALWTDGDPDGKEVLRRVKSLPGFGDQKAKIFVALLGKQWDVQPPGWREAAGPYGAQDARMSVADVFDEESLAAVRAYKKEAKAAAKDKASTAEPARKTAKKTAKKTAAKKTAAKKG